MKVCFLRIFFGDKVDVVRIGVFGRRPNFFLSCFIFFIVDNQVKKHSTLFDGLTQVGARS